MAILTSDRSTTWRENTSYRNLKGGDDRTYRMRSSELFLHPEPYFVLLSFTASSIGLEHAILYLIQKERYRTKISQELELNLLCCPGCNTPSIPESIPSGFV